MQLPPELTIIYGNKEDEFENSISTKGKSSATFLMFY